MSEETDALYRDDPRATVKQVEYIKILCRDSWLFQKDFPNRRSYHRKRTLTELQADQLIKLGCERRRPNAA